MADRGGPLSDSRPRKFNRNRARAIITALMAGNFRSVAARYAGIAPGTLTKWIERGKSAKPGTVMAKFFADVEQAEAEAIVSCHAVVQRALGEDNWKAAIALLQARWPDKYGPKATLTIEQQAPPPEKAKKALDEYGLTAAQIDYMGEMLARLESGQAASVPALTDALSSDEDEGE